MRWSELRRLSRAGWRTVVRSTFEMTSTPSPRATRAFAAAAGLTLSFASPCAQAHVHETYQACVARYGQPVEKRDGTSVRPQKVERLVHFEKGAYTVTIGFVEDRAVSLVLSHTD